MGPRATAIKHLFTDHPDSVGETYFEHMGVAMSFSLALIVASAVCFVHALAPWLFTKSASNAVDRLHDRMVLNRHRHPRADGDMPANARTEP